MKTLKTLEPLTRRLLEIQRVNSAASVLSWDQETYMPAGGGAARAEQIATLQGIAHQKLVSLETERLLGGWLDLHTGVARLQPFQKITVRFCHAVESRVLVGATGVGRSKSAKQFQIVPAQPANGLVAEA